MEDIKNEYRGLPFWSWNGDLDKDEIIRQVHVLKSMGFGGFFMHSRTGLATEYLGDKWFELIRLASSEAQKLGMDAWLYDEDRWPSGTCGGEVTKNVLNRLKFFSIYDTSPDDYITDKSDVNLLNIFAVKLGADNTFSDYYIYDGAALKPGYELKKIVLEYMAGQDFYNGFTYLDTLNLDATNAYIQSTHELYKKKCGDLFGKSLIGIFTDEPHRGALMNGFGIVNANKNNMMPATYKTCEQFLAEKGYSLKDRLIELFYMADGAKVNKVMFDYIGVTQNMFINNFAKPYHDWCVKNNLIFTGHVLHEDSLVIQTIFQGSCQRFYEYMDYPGVDILTEDNRAYWVAKQVQSVARQLDKKFVLSELYGCTGWQTNFESHRDIGAWQALFGINLRCHHLSWYTMEGESKRDYPASILHQSGWYKDYPFIEDYFARLNQLLSSGEPYARTLVLNPVESVWLYPRLNWIENTFSPTVPEAKNIDKNYYELFTTLNEGQIDFDYGDEDIIKRHYAIKNIGGEAVLCVGSAKYSVVVLNSNVTIRQSTLEILSQFIASGGKVVCVGAKPEYIDGVQKSGILSDCQQVDLCQIVDCLEGVRFFSATGKLFSTTRKVGEDYYIALLNPDRQSKVDSTVLLKNSYSIKEIDLHSGNQQALYCSVNSFKTVFNAGELRVFLLSKSPITLPKASALQVSKQLTLQGDYSYELSEDNVLPLDIFSYEFDGKKYPSTEILQLDRNVRDIMGLKYRGGEMIQPWYSAKYGSEQTAKSQKLTITANINIRVIPTHLTLVMEQSEKFNVYLNGKKIDLVCGGHWIDVCFDKIPLDCKNLFIGKNELTFVTDFNQDVNLEAAYLLGDFGVKLTDDIFASVVALPKTLAIGDVTTQGLPFYSGSITYNTGIKNQTVGVKLGGCYGALTKAKDSSQAQNSQIIAFPPFETNITVKDELQLQVVLTRRNTFGPLHLIDKFPGAYGPETFVAKDLQQAKYNLIAQGLLQPPVVTIFKK